MFQKVSITRFDQCFCHWTSSKELLLQYCIHALPVVSITSIGPVLCTPELLLQLESPTPSELPKFVGVVPELQSLEGCLGVGEGVLTAIRLQYQLISANIPEIAEEARFAKLVPSLFMIWVVECYDTDWCGSRGSRRSGIKHTCSWGWVNRYAAWYASSAAHAVVST